MFQFPQEIIFFHGTSFESLDRILEEGLFPNSSFSVYESEFKRQMMRRFGVDIKGFERQAHFDYSQEGAFQLAKEYAKSKSVFDFCGSFCPDSNYFHGDSDYREHHVNVVDNTTGELERGLFEELLKWNSYEEAVSILNKASLRNGVVLGFDDSLIINPNDIDMMPGYHIIYPLSSQRIPPFKIKYIFSQDLVLPTPEVSSSRQISLDLF